MSREKYLVNATPIEPLSDLASDANAATIVTKVNELFARLEAAKIMRPLYAIKYTLTKVTQTSQPTEAGNDVDTAITLAAAANYNLPTAVTVKVGGKTITASATTYTWGSGTLTLKKEIVTGDVEIIATGTASS